MTAIAIQGLTDRQGMPPPREVLPTLAERILPGNIKSLLLQTGYWGIRMLRASLSLSLSLCLSLACRHI